MEDEKVLEIYNLTIKLLECVENEYSIHKHNTSKKIFLEDIISRIHGIRIRIQTKNLKKEAIHVREN